MAALRGPDSSEDERRLGEQAVFPETVDVNIRQLDPIPAPRAFLKEQPLTDEMSELVLHSRQEIRDVLNGRDDRLLVIVGPCSIHDPKAAHEYAEKLAAVKRELEDRLVIVMRVYFEKPRHQRPTTALGGRLIRTRQISQIGYMLLDTSAVARIGGKYGVERRARIEILFRMIFRLMMEIVTLIDVLRN